MSGLFISDISQESRHADVGLVAMFCAVFVGYVSCCIRGVCFVLCSWGMSAQLAQLLSLCCLRESIMKSRRRDYMEMLTVCRAWHPVYCMALVITVTYMDVYAQTAVNCSFEGWHCHHVS